MVVPAGTQRRGRRDVRAGGSSIRRHLDELAGALPAKALVTDPDRLASFAHDQAGFTDRSIRPLAVVQPRTTPEVQVAVRWADRHGVPLVPRGAGSGLAGGANAVAGGIVLSLHRMDRIIEVDAEAGLATVEPGVITAEVDRAAGRHGLWYPPDPASKAFCTIGGNVATNAGGLCCIRHGVTRDYVLGLEVVVADGRALRIGRRTRKGVAGYDLVSLFVGSEGTLGVVTEILLRLVPRPAPVPTLVAQFATLPAAGRAVESIITDQVPVMLELMDRTTVAAVDSWKRMDLDREAAALLLGQPVDAVALERMESACAGAGASLVVCTEDPDEGDLLLEARRLAYPALERLGTTLLDDVAVPPTRIHELLARIEELARRHGVTIGTFGHAGEGNLHPTLVYDGEDAAAVAAAAAAFDELLEVAVALGGTVTGEHGVGLLKRKALVAEQGADLVSLQQAVKRVFDPNGIMNPGKVFLPPAAS